MKTSTRFTLNILMVACVGLISPATYAGEQAGGARKPCKPPKCGKVNPGVKNEVSMETLEIKPGDNATGAQAQSGTPTQRSAPKLSNDDFNPGPTGHTRKLSNDEQFPGVKH